MLDTVRNARQRLTMGRMLPLLAVLLVSACGPAGGGEPAATNKESSQLELGEAVVSADNEAESRPLAVDSAPAEVALAPPAVEPAVTEYDANGIEVGFTKEGRPYRGSPNAPVLIQEFSDFQCPYCARFFGNTQPSLEKNQIANGDVLLVFYDFPLSSIHSEAVSAANAARCAGEQSAVAYWEMHDLIFASTDWHNDDSLGWFVSSAAGIGLDVGQFSDCQESLRYEDAIQADFDYGRSRDIRSTPSFLINDQPLIGAQSIAVFNSAIATVLSGQTIAQAEEPSVQTGQPAVKPTPAFISLDDSAGVVGDPGAPVTIIEYTDYQCPYCQRHVSETMPAILSELISSGRVRYVLKDFPLDSLHPSARAAAAAARCAGEQNAYWEMHDLIFESQAQWSGAGTEVAGILSELADQLGLDVAQFETCVGSGRFDAVVQANQDEGAALGVRGTPFFFVNGFPINGAQPYELFEYAVSLAEEGTLADAYVPPDEPEQTAPAQPTGPVDVPIETSYSIGEPDAPVIIVEYTDFQCPYCSRHFQETVPKLKANFIDTGLVRYVFKDFPLTNIHPQAVVAAEAARCAGDQNAYLEMHDLLFARQGEWSGKGNAAQLFTGYAQEIGLDGSAFEACVQSHVYQEAVLADLQEGAALGVGGTPAFFLNGHFLSGAQPYEVFEGAINQLLADG